jgi:hypothetical protein
MLPLASNLSMSLPISDIQNSIPPLAPELARPLS